jgi:hypothetical protein
VDETAAAQARRCRSRPLAPGEVDATQMTRLAVLLIGSSGLSLADVERVILRGCALELMWESTCHGQHVEKTAGLLDWLFDETIRY